MSKLTEYLLSALPHSVAVAEHAFLRSAASLATHPSRLALYLFQEHVYCTHAFPRFIAQLILKIPLDNPSAAPLATRSLSLLSKCLTFINAEFSDGTANTHNLSLDNWRERKGTQDLIAEMARVGAFGTLEDGLVFLWAVEKVFSDAWSTVYHALPKLSPSEAQSQPPAEHASKAIRDIAEHWAGPEFVQFLQELGNLVNDYFAPVMAGQPLAGQSAPEVLAREEAVLVRVIELEMEIWPNTDDETTHRVRK